MFDVNIALQIFRVYLLIVSCLVNDAAVADTRGAQIFKKSVSHLKIKHYAISVLRIYTY